MTILHELTGYQVIAEAPERGVLNVTPASAGDIDGLRALVNEVQWNWPRTYCAVCMEPFIGERCATCGIPRRTRR